MPANAGSPDVVYNGTARTVEVWTAAGKNSRRPTSMRGSLNGYLEIAVTQSDEPNERALGERLRALGAELRMTRKGRVHTIDFRSAPAGFGAGALACMDGLQRLKELHLAGTDVDDAAAEALTRHNHLETLDLEGTSVTDAALPHVARMKQLKLLVLRGTPVSAEAVAAIRKEMIGTRIVT